MLGVVGLWWWWKGRELPGWEGSGFVQGGEVESWEVAQDNGEGEDELEVLQVLGCVVCGLFGVQCDHWLCVELVEGEGEVFQGVVSGVL